MINMIQKQHPYETGKLYNRKEGIHLKYGGSRQSGISPSADHPYVFIFTGETGEQYGYKDGYDDEGIFHYTGEGQTGDMVFKSGNKAIRDHKQNGKDLLLFQHRGKGKPYRFLGQFICIGYEYKTIPDRDDRDRQGIVFQLMNIEDGGETGYQEDIVQPKTSSLEQLREKAYSAVKPVKEAKSRENRKIYYERNKDIKAYVLARAKGTCECCGQPAPFNKPDGTPYLETHHIGKLSDSGMDTPDRMAAITPNCHREIHYGLSGKEIDARLSGTIAEKEKVNQ